MLLLWPRAKILQYYMTLYLWRFWQKKGLYSISSNYCSAVRRRLLFLFFFTLDWGEFAFSLPLKHEGSRANSRKLPSPPIVLSWYSWNCPLTKRSTKLDFPTADSPRSTNLNWQILLLGAVPLVRVVPPRPAIAQCWKRRGGGKMEMGKGSVGCVF